MIKKIAILGSTGSIGTQALDVIRANPDKFSVEVITARHNADLIIQQCQEFKPKYVVLTDQDAYQKVLQSVDNQLIKFLFGESHLAEIVQLPEIDMVLTALVGYCGLLPTMKAIEAGKDIALANKETLVVAGELIMALAEKRQVKIIPVDSEHSAIFQCLVGEEKNAIEKIILTASGGPFRGKQRTDLQTVTKEQALKHPNWAMGAKITIDSASLMNKGLEVIEAKWLFGLDVEQVEVIVHPQSIIHSLVQFEDGSIKAQMGLPDMKLPIQYALAYPQRIKSDFPRFDFGKYPNLTFEKPDLETFRNLQLAFMALEKSGNMPCILNAANEIAVEFFLKDKVKFLQMPDLIADCMAKIPYIAKPNYDDYVQTDQDTRRLAKDLIE
jgi:1-deoxy-D-xylulose-5-phosphate reductoisomerase